MVILNEAAASRIIDGSKVAISSNAPILVTTVVDINSLAEPTALGKVIQEQNSTAFTKQGYNVVELKMKPGVSVRDTGDIALTRNATELVNTYKVQAILTGTYAITDDMTAVVTLKLINPSNNIALSAYSYSLPTGGLNHLTNSRYK